MTGPDGPDGFDRPDGPDGPDRPVVRRVLVVPSPDPVRLARACAGLGVRGHVVPAGGACAVVLDPTGDDAATPRLSRVLGRAPLLLLVRTDGQVTAERWIRGALADAPQAGLLLASLPDVVSTLLVGSADPSEADGAVRISLRPGAAGAAGAAGAHDGPAPGPTRRGGGWGADRLASLAVAVVAGLFALVEGARAATADGSWLVVGLALAVAVGMAALASRRRPGTAAADTAAPSPPTPGEGADDGRAS